MGAGRILKVEPRGFADALDGNLKGSKELKITPRTDECTWVELVRSCLFVAAGGEVK